ncbi:MAG: sugar phosphate isomerase/epimerase [Lentisphaerae bacterium]|nr:sugar phosphate isomerase/epimerase [Lentisphaerota bacterium]MBR2871976.1 sugar phosphate isomerase/epimerase [Lentisphaeria bacterium]
MKIGVIVESFCEELHTALQSAAKMGIQGVQIYARHRSHDSLIDMTSAQRADLLKYIKDLGMEVSSICGDLGGHGFQDKEGNPERIELSKKIIDACCELETKVMTTHVGVVPTKDDSPVYQEMVRVAKVVGEYAVANGVTLAIETGPEPAVRLRHYLEDIGLKGIGVNFDPANLAMVCCDDAEKAAEVLGPWIVHTHAKDGKNLRPCNPANEYGSLELSDLTPGYDKAALGRAYLEVPLGQGDVNWDGYFRTLKKINYNGFLTIEREVGDTPKADIQLAVDFLKARMW